MNAGFYKTTKKSQKQQQRCKLQQIQAINYPKEFELICRNRALDYKSSKFIIKKIKEKLEIYDCFKSSNVEYTSGTNTAILNCVYENKLHMCHSFKISINETKKKIPRDPEILQTVDISDQLIQLLVRTFCHNN